MPLFPATLTDLAREVITKATQKKLRIVTAESCTGGLVSASLTEIPGSSQVFDRGFATYSDASKMAHLDVERKTILDFGAVSPETALEMAQGALAASHADLAISVTGISGPSGGTDEKPVGLVYIGVVNSKYRDDDRVEKHTFPGERGAVRQATVEAALRALVVEIEKG